MAITRSPVAPFRILCLHGQGTNGRIFASQTVTLRATLPSYYTYTFLDAPIRCAAAPGGVGDIFPDEDFRCWYTSPSTRRVSKAQDVVRREVERIGQDGNGRIRGVMGFSQGAALAASFIIHQQLANEHPLFDVAIFICSPVPFSTDVKYGIDTRTYFGLGAGTPSRDGAPDRVPEYLITDKAYLNGEEEEEEEEEQGDELDDAEDRRSNTEDGAEYFAAGRDWATLQKEREKMTGLFAKGRLLDDMDFGSESSRSSGDGATDTEWSSPASSNASSNTSMANSMALNSPMTLPSLGKLPTSTYYQMFHPIADTVRIAIPTAHIYGREDSWRRHSMDLVQLCDPLRRDVYQHEGGHAVPSLIIEDVEGICNIIEGVVGMVKA